MVGDVGAPEGVREYDGFWGGGMAEDEGILVAEAEAFEHVGEEVGGCGGVDQADAVVRLCVGVHGGPSGGWGGLLRIGVTRRLPAELSTGGLGQLMGVADG